MFLFFTLILNYKQLIKNCHFVICESSCYFSCHVSRRLCQGWLSIVAVIIPLLSDNSSTVLFMLLLACYSVIIAPLSHIKIRNIIFSNMFYMLPGNRQCHTRTAMQARLICFHFMRTTLCYSNHFQWFESLCLQRKLLRNTPEFLHFRLCGMLV